MNYDYIVSPIRVSVPSFKESKVEKNSVFFTIELQSKDNKWYVEKRFSEFDSLVKSLKLNYHSLPKLPEKGFPYLKMSDKDLEARRKGLEQFLRGIVTRNDLMNSDLVKQFLQLDKNAAEMMVNPPKLLFEYSIDGQTKGIRDYVYLEDENVFIIATADMSPMSRLNAKVSNTKLPWESPEKANTFMEVGSVEAWAASDKNNTFIKKWSKGYPKQAICVSYDSASNRIMVGLDDGVIDIITMTANGYEDIACVKCHQNRVMGLSYDSLSNVGYSVSQDKVFRVSHGSSLAMIFGIPHKQQLLSMIKDKINKRIFVGTKGGQVSIYDISQAEKPKVLIVLSNNKKGAIRAMSLDTKRNYLFTGSFDDGQLNVFDLDKPGREKYAKLNATLMGKQKVRSVTWSAKRTEIMSGTADGAITFWNAVEGKSIYVLQSFDNEITCLEYIEEKEMLISASKGKSIKIWQLPKEWRDAKLVHQEKKIAGKILNDYNKQKVSNAVRKAEEDSDDDDLAGWHLD